MQLDKTFRIGFPPVLVVFHYILIHFFINSKTVVMKRKIKAWLKKNHLTPDQLDYFILLELLDGMSIDDIIEELRKDGMELNPATVKDVITRFNSKCIDLLMRGHSINTGLVHMRLSVKGITYDKTWDPELNPLHVVISQGKEIVEAIDETEVEIMGEHPDPIAIFSIVDLSTSKTDGSITRKFNAEIKGTYIKVTGNDPTCGIYLHNEVRQIDYKLNDVNIVHNDPSKILILVPEDIEPDTYELRIVTQYTGSKKTLKNTRSVICPIPITVL
jgi:hypothetical protein